MNIDNVLSKMKKLQAMIDGSKNINEVAVAERLLNELATQYNLSLSDVNSLDLEDISREELVDEYWGGENNERNRKIWRNQLGFGLAKYYFCSIYTNIEYGGKRRIKIVGKKANVELFRFVLNNVVTQFEIISKNTPKSDFIHGKTFYNNLLRGMVSGFLSKVNAEHRAKYGSNSAYNQLVVNNRKEIDDYMESLNLRKQKITSNYLPGAYSRGVELGKSINVQSGMAGAVSSQVYLK